ncbi:terminase large subunit [Brevundimonas aurantiaca]|uniref:terminase large subunit n=1 Tax=Brevundimonas aurantiaca TaxID=74316 RepID=UPI00301A8382
MGAAAELTVPSWNFAVPDWVERLKEGRSLVPELPLDLAEADRAVGIFNKLRLPDVPGQPAMADAAGDWFRDIVRAAFGSIEAETGRRRVAEVFLGVPKKNSKTTNGAGLAVTALLMNKRPRAELLLVAPTQEIADLAFQQASGMIEADPDGYLQKRYHVQEHLKTIVDRRNKAKLKIKTFSMTVMTGTKPVFVLLDEVHLLSAFHYASRVIGQIRGGFEANPEGLFVMITTQSDAPPSGVFKTELQLARDIRDGKVTEDVRTLPVLYEFPAEMQVAEDQPWRDPSNWHMVLPNAGRSVHIERLLTNFRRAEDKGKEELIRWASQHLNVEIGMALHADRWRGADYWQAAGVPGLTLQEILRRCDVVTAGIDGGGLDDLLGLAIVGRDRETKEWLIWVKAWAHDDVLERRKDIAEVLRDFEADGDLVICSDAEQPIREVAAIIAEINDQGLFPEKYGIGLDPYGVAALVDELASHSIQDEQLSAVRQGAALSPATWGAEIKLKSKTLLHCAQRLLAWCVGNAKAETRGGATLITKETAGRAKIDPLVAVFNAMMLMARNPEAKGRSVYKGRGLLVL